MISFFNKHLKGHLLLCPFFILLVGCVSPGPARQEYNLAKVALQAAKDAEAKRYSPKVFSQANRYMRKGERSYKDRDFGRAEEYFKKCRFYSEKAENVSRVKMFKQGEVAP